MPPVTEPTTSAPEPKTSSAPEPKPQEGKAADADPLPPRAGGPTVDIGSMYRSQINITQHIKDVLIDSDAQARVSKFSPKDVGALTINRVDEISSASQFVYDEHFVRESLNVLCRSRLLLLIGEPDCGKESIARYLASRLREDGSLDRDTLVIPPLAEDMRLHLHSTLRDNGELHSRVVIFPDALERGNSGLRDFIARLKGDAVSNVGRDLAQVNSYVIVTAVKASIPSDCVRNLPGWLHPTIPALPAELVLRGTEQRIARFLAKSSDPALAQAVTNQLKREIAERACTVSRAVRFIESSLVRVLRGEITVQKAFDELDSLGSWFQNNADSDREAWIYALALIVSHSLGRDDDIPWSEFSGIYDDIRAQIWRGHKVEITERPFDEDRFQMCAGAEIKRDPLVARDLIGFRDPGAARRLWDVLLSRFRSIAKSLVPVLIALTKNDNVLTRARAAQALGRIGWLDAKEMTTQWVEEWAASDSFSQRALAGYLAQGVFSTGDVDYRQFFLELLDRYSRNKKMAWTAMAAYKQIGRMDLAVALEKLKYIAEIHLVPAFEASREIRLLMDQLDRKLAGIRSEEAALVREILDNFGVFYLASLKGDVEIAESLKFTLVSLSMTSGLAPILATLSQWALGSSGMGALVCYVFLMEGGIASELTRRRMGLVLHSADRIEIVPCSAILASLADDSHAVQSVVRFLETMYAVLLEFFPPDAAASLTHVLFDHLETWVQESLPTPLCRTAMVELVGRLLRSNLNELYERTYDWLSAGSEFSKGDMASFAKDARRFGIKGN